MTDTFDPIAYINTPRWRESKLGLHRMIELLRLLGNPQNSLRFVHVAGTNGKGSTCAYLASVLKYAGYRTGEFTSPYIETFEERIRVDGINISPDELTRATYEVRRAATEVEHAIGEHPTEFELMFAVALEHFRIVGCDIVVCEVGLGGRLDATNVIETLEACVICRIGLDHTEMLGDTLAKIAAEKAGIIKQGVPVITWPQEPEAAAVIEQATIDRDCSITTPDFSELCVSPLRVCSGMRHFAYRGKVYETCLLAAYQPYNATLAIETVGVLRERGWAVTDSALVEGIAHACLPGRFEVIGRQPLVIVDGAHNPQGCVALADSLDELLKTNVTGGDRSIVFVMGVLADKNYREMIRVVLPYARAFITYAPRNPRALDAAVLAQAIEEQCEASALSEMPPVQTASTPADAMIRAHELADADSVIVAFGSLYGVSDIKASRFDGKTED